MEERIKAIMREHNITMYQIAEGTGLSYSTIRGNLQKINRYSLENFIIVAEYLSKRTDSTVSEIIGDLLQYNSTYKNAIKREERRIN